jgi:hypothetical protein
MPKLSPPRATRPPRTCAMTPHAPDLFDDAPGVGEMTARYAASSRQGASADVLRERVRAGGLDGLNDAETLELLLSRSMPCGAKAHAAALLCRFGCLRRVLAADFAALSAIVDRAPASWSFR